MNRWQQVMVSGLMLVSPVFAQPVKLAEAVQLGQHFKYELALNINGTMAIEQNGKAQDLPLRGEATHSFVERVDATDTNGAAGQVLRHYSEAKSAASVGGELSRRVVREERRLVLVQRQGTTTVNCCPNGPLTREELDLVEEHFDTLGLPMLLPGKEVNIGDTWKLSPEATQQTCLFDGVIQAELIGELLSHTGGVAKFAIRGTAEGLENGAVVKVNVKAEGAFDTATSHLTSLTWVQDDERALGPVSPASKLQATLTLKRTALKDAPSELSSEATAKVPSGKITDEQLLLSHADPDGKFALAYPRAWVIVGRSGSHTVLRLLSEGNFQAQATITVWSREQAGQHSKLEDFKAAVGKVPGWEPSEVLADEEVKLSKDNWCHRYSVRGKRDGAEVVQCYYFLAGASGQQVVVTFLTALNKATEQQKAYETLLRGLSFPVNK
jgi:hypothetical protein